MATVAIAGDQAARLPMGQRANWPDGPAGVPSSARPGASAAPSARRLTLDGITGNTSAASQPPSSR